MGLGDASIERLQSIFEEVIAQEVDGDGLAFDANTLQIGPIRDDQVYGGIRAILTAHLANAKIRLQIDVGFGDAITPNAEDTEVPSLLGFPAARLRAYPRETVVAEKLEAMVQLGELNSRMKDFFDLMVLARQFEFDGSLLARAVLATFERRQTLLPQADPIALQDAFAADSNKLLQWQAFVRKSGLSNVPAFGDVIAELREFLVPVLDRLRTEEAFTTAWPPGGPWNPL